jgi:predicted NBD/HSP70 family sugar kinase
LGFCDDAFAIIGVSMGATHVTVVLTDLRGQVRVARFESCPVREKPEKALRQTIALIEEVLASERVPRGRLVGIGVGVPSPVHPSSPGRLLPLILPAWRDVDLLGKLHQAFEVPVFVDNDANVGALSESWWGVGQGGHDLTYIKIGTGIGSGHIIKGQLYRGAGGTAGEIGHLAIDPAGPLCVCGLRGCLQTFVGSRPMAERARSLGLTGPSGDTPTVDDIITAAKGGDTAAQQVIDEVGNQLGIAVAGLLNLLNPAIVVLGGQITTVGDLLLDPLRTALKRRALSTSVAETRIMTSNLGKHAIPVGAATLVLQAALQDQQLFPPPPKERSS